MSQILYCGPAGSGLGFQLSGMAVQAPTDSEDLLANLKKIKKAGEYQLIFIDENLAEPVLEEITALNQDPFPTIVLLPSPGNPQYLASKKMNQMMVKAVGSDILNL